MDSIFLYQQSAKTGDWVVDYLFGCYDYQKYCRTKNCWETDWFTSIIDVVMYVSGCEAVWFLRFIYHAILDFNHTKFKSGRTDTLISLKRPIWSFF